MHVYIIICGYVYISWYILGYIAKGSPFPYGPFLSHGRRRAVTVPQENQVVAPMRDITNNNDILIFIYILTT